MLQKWWKNRRKNGGTLFQLWNYNLGKLKIWFPAIKMVFNRKIYQWRLLDKNNARATFSFAHCHLPGNDCQREWLGTSFGLRGSTVIGLLHSRVVHKCCDAVNSCNRLKCKCKIHCKSTPGNAQGSLNTESYLSNQKMKARCDFKISSEISLIVFSSF